MANVDTSIYGNIRPFTMEDPLSQAAKAMQVQAAGMQIKDAQRKFTLEDDISGALAESGGDYTKASTLLAQRGRGNAAISLADKANAQKKAQIEQQLKIAEAVGSDAMMLDQTWRQALQASGGDATKALEKISPVYANVRAKWSQMGHQLPEKFDPNQNFAGIGAAKENIQYLKTLAPDITMVDTGGSIVPSNKNPLAGPVGPLAGAAPIAKTAAPAAPTELARLQTELAAMAPDDPRRPQHERAIAGFKAGRGVEVINNPPGPMTPGKTAGGKIDEALLDSTEGLMRLDTIASQFKPEYQTIATKGGNWWSSVKEKAGVNLTNKEKKDLEDFSAYKRNAINSLNQYIKSVTGAAMSNEEAKRILKGMPNPGEGVFDGDSPSEFKSKLDDAMRQTRMAVARGAYLKRNGMSLEDGLGKGITLEKMPAMMNARGKELEGVLRQRDPNAKDEAVQRAVRRQLATEFGLSSD